ncbi:MAG TPA: hypothetical protein VFQ77_03270 [Pseudonocardiaceae bacterium]|nr:hypothetical protein [Pseudonocardiaceae bacterium]
MSEQVIDALLYEVDAALAEAAPPTSALLDGSAAERRRRRMERRAVAAVLRALPAHRGACGPDGQVA